MDMVVLGKLVAPYGLEGWLHLQTFADDAADWSSIPTWYVGDEKTGWRAISHKKLKAHHTGLLVWLDGVNDRSAAAHIQGAFLAAPKDTLPQLPANEYYWGDLMGLSVVNTTGVLLGEVVDLMATGANDVLDVCHRREDGTIEKRLLPFVSQVVQSVNLEKREILVDWQADW